ncbi:hypothetical protein DSAG12_01259 [Promethearchaeum syntrophicum]|uniref:Uncharacterized protein n=1 Tax=Promethearchaeum syntrophicum TaxID=2594042 RepID=A0A5B9D8K0_9ARCH|nr:hypothetical protein [Candidatus Prometheoarchaeum syntrophicum]
MKEKNMKRTRPEKYKDPQHFWDDVNEKSEFLYIASLNNNKKSDKVHIKDIYHNYPTATLINTFDFPPNSITDLENIPQILPNLKTFIINTSDFKSLKGFPEELPNLKILNIKSPQISDLSPLSKTMPSLERFFISKCEVSYLNGIPEDLPKLDRIFLDSIPIKNLEGIPSLLPNLKHMKIKHIPIKSLKNLPESLPNVEKIEISGTHITNLQYLPEDMPTLKELILARNNLTSLKGMPNELPKLLKIDISHNHLSHLKFLPNVAFSSCIIIRKNNPIRTLHGINDRFFKQFLSKAMPTVNLCPKGLEIIKKYNPSYYNLIEIVNEAKKFYKKSSHELAQQYVSNPQSLNEGEIERLIWEANFDDRKLLENVVSANDSVLQKISQRLEIPLNSDFSLLK